MFFFFFTLVTGPTRSFSLKLSDTRVYAPAVRAMGGETDETVTVGMRLKCEK